MKKLFRKNIFTVVYLIVLTNMISLWSLAQDSSSQSATTTTQTTTTQNGTTVQPWMWIVGGVVLLVIILALLSGRNKNTVSSDKVTYTKTVERE